MNGMVISLNIRKTLVSALFSKVVKLSMRSITITNSGKLISLISADLFLIEKGLAMSGLLFAALFINLFAGYLFVGILGWKYTLIIFGFWFFNMGLQYYSSTVFKRLKSEESAINDERLKLINDMVIGCRTIKCYGWENHYTEKINAIRAR